MHFFCIFFQFYLDNSKICCTFAPQFGKVIHRKRQKRRQKDRKSEASEPIPIANIKDIHNNFNIVWRLELKLAAKLQKSFHFTKFFERKIQ